MNNIEPNKQNNDVAEMKNTHSNSDIIHLQNELNLNENDLDTNQKNLKSNKKFSINTENIRRKNKILETKLRESIEIPSKSQIIVISRKRKREENSEFLLSNELKETHNIIDKEIDMIIPNKKFRIDKQHNFDLSNKLNKLKLQVPETDLSNSKLFEIKIKSRNLNGQNNCNNFLSKKNNMQFSNYHPLETPTDFSLKIMQETFNSKLQDKFRQISELRLLKFMEKRNILSSGKLMKQFDDIKMNCNIFFENYKIINENDDEKLIIVNHNPVDKEQIKAFLELNMVDTPDLKIYECSNNMNDSDILNLIAKDDIVLVDELQSDSDINNELDYDSNCEDNSYNDYPDEKEDDDDDSNKYCYQDYCSSNSS